MIGTRFQTTDQIRNHIVLFAVAFRNIVIQRNGKDIRVPVSFANKERFFGKINSQLHSPDPRDNKRANVETVLPRISFNITNMQYKPEMKTPSTNTKTFEQPDGTVTAQFVPAPYEVQVEMSVYTRYEEDMLRIMEQIVPFFQPHITLQMETEIEYPHIRHRDVHITLNNIQPEQDLYGTFEERRTLVWNYDFTMSPVYIYPPHLDGIGKITKILLDFATGTEDVPVKEYDEAQREVVLDEQYEADT